MSNPADLPGRMSHTDELADLQQRVLGASSSCGTSSLFKQFLNSGSTKLRALPYRYLRHGFIALSIPAALIAGSVLPAARPATAPVAPVAAAYAVQAGLSAFQGDAAVPDAATSDEVVVAASSMSLGAPVNRQYAAVSADVANLRGGPSTSAERIGKLKLGQTVKLLGRSGEWYKVQTNGGQIGWMHGEVVDVDAEVADSLVTIKTTQAAPASTVRVGTTTDENVNLRSGPGTDNEVITKLPEGMKLEVLNQQDGWFKVATPKGTVGWVTDDFFTVGASAAPAAAPSSSVPMATVTEGSVNLRQGPNTRFGSFGKMAEGTALTVIARNGEWFKVKSPRGTIGWVADELIDFTNGSASSVPVTNDVPALPQPAKPKPAASASAPSIKSSHDAASIALRFIGARYVYGGSNPRGFDCSGLTSYVYRQLGINLPRTARSQFSTGVGQRVSMSQLAPGDLVFFANTAGRGITHVALYVGNGMMVSANTPRTGVQYVSIYGSYWRSHFAGAIRPFR